MSGVPQVPARFVDPGSPPTPQTVVSRWDQFLGSIASGMPLQDAMLKHFMKRSDIETMTRKSALEMKRWRDAKIAALRCAFSEFDLDEFFDRVAKGMKVADAYMEVFGREVEGTFYRLLREDQDMADRYRASQETKAMLEMEKAVDIIDDDANDTLPGPKGGEIPNMAAVQRSRLRFEGRHKIAAATFRRLYGDKEAKTEVTVNIDLAERLERAIGNARDRKVTPRQMSQAIDATYTEVKPMDTSWMDEKPTDPIWREES